MSATGGFVYHLQEDISYSSDWVERRRFVAEKLLYPMVLFC